MAVSSISVYGIVLAGWSSNNKYALMGGDALVGPDDQLRTGAGAGLRRPDPAGRLDEPAGHRRWRRRTVWYIVYQPIGFVVFLLASIAEVNRAPFDMPEAEQELTAGYHSEYSGMKFALVLHGRVRQDDRRQRHRRHAVPGRLLAGPFRAIRSPLARADLPVRQGRGDPALDDLDAGDAAALPLRPADGLRLEGPAAAGAGERGPDGGW